MGNILSCIDEMPELQRIRYDMTPIHNKKVPIIWLVGPPGSGRNTQSETMAEHLKFENIRVAEILRQEALKDTERGRVVKSLLGTPKKVSDTIVVDLIKEEMLERIHDAEGFILNGFPRTSKQAVTFVKEIGNVDAVIYLYSNTNDMITRIQQKRGVIVNPEILKKDIITYIRETKEGTAKFTAKMERVYTDASIFDVYKKIESALSVRLLVPAPLPKFETTSRLTVKADTKISTSNTIIQSN